MTDRPRLDCLGFVTRVSDYLERALDDAERDLFEKHAVDCPGCGHYLRQMRLVIRALGALATREDPAPVALPEVLSRELRRRRR